jgi:hypothetical protein
MTANTPDSIQTKKDAKGSYDPQVGAAAQANTALAERTQAWTEDFYAQHITPMLEAMSKATADDNTRQGALFDMNMSQAKLQDERYRGQGIPAEDAYYQMVKDYSAPEEQERQAQGALGDVRTAAGVQQQNLTRTMAASGVDPTSPAAIAARSDMAVQGAAMEAAAQTRARSAAQALGMQLKSDAANFGRGGQSGILQFGAAAGGNSSAAAGSAQSGVGSAVSGAAPMQGAFGIAQKAYGANLDAYAGMNQASISANAQMKGGLMSGLGSMAGLAMGGYFGGK